MAPGAHDAPDGDLPAKPIGGSGVVLQRNGERNMDQDTKHEIVVLTLGTLAAIPVVTGIGLVVVTGLLAW